MKRNPMRGRWPGFPVLEFAIARDGESPKDSDWRPIGGIRSMNAGSTFTYFPMRNGIRKITVKKIGSNDPY